MAALILLALGLTEKPPALKANNLSVPVEVSVHSALGRGVMGVRLWTWHDNPISATDIEFSYQLHMLLYTECMLIVLIGLA